MAKKKVPALRQATDAVAVLGQQIKVARMDRGWTIADLAGRMMVSTKTVSAIESGATGTAIGHVFNAAALTGVDLFGLPASELTTRLRLGNEKLALLPSRVRHPALKDDPNDFAF